nr:fibroblast growth factor-binding protein 3 [Anas platyrhynchos]
MPRTPPLPPSLRCRQGTERPAGCGRGEEHPALCPTPGRGVGGGSPRPLISPGPAPPPHTPGPGTCRQPAAHRTGGGSRGAEEMRRPLALLAPLALLVALGAAGGGPGEAAQTGRFSTPERHRCQWELRWAAGASELRLSCRPPAGGGAARSCVYRGEPRRCPAYGARSRRYWRQVIAHLRRRRRPCAEGAPLGPRQCGPGRAPPEAQLRLLLSSPGHDPGPTPPPPASAEPPERLVETYCAQRWHSLCSFFVGFWQG